MDSDAEKRFVKELGNALKEERLVVGVERCIKELKSGNSRLVVVSKNCPYKARIQDAAKSGAGGVEIIELENKNNVELGELCKKPFKVSTAAILLNAATTKGKGG